MSQSLMIVELGHFALILALFVALAQTIVPILGAQRGNSAMMATAAPLSLVLLLLVSVSFLALALAYLGSDFSVRNVFENSHTAKPLIYKFTGVWGNHEGSMLLWVFILALFGASVPLFGRHLPLQLKANTIGVQGSVALAFLLFIVLTSNPFLRLNPAPLEGQDLNPILQDIGLAIHPPLLYLGYVGFSVTFAFAIAALLSGRLDSAWARWVRPWALAAWVFLTLGIAMGSYWAYYELGWGGWWFWDPVENASLLPWLSGTALIHSAIVVEKRNALRIWTVLLAIITFSLSLLGTFLVRSGVLTSVHTFATDPTRGLAILLILIVFIGGAFALFAKRAPSLAGGGLFAPISREGALVFNNLFLSALCATVLIGTLYPLLYEALTGGKISVGPPFFNLTTVPLALPLLLALPYGPFLTWKRGDVAGITQRLIFAGILSVLGAVAALVIMGGTFAPLGFALGVWLIVGALSEILWRARLGKAGIGETVRRLANMPGSAWGSALGHMGVGVMVLGIVGSTAWRVENFVEVKVGDSSQVAGYTLVLDAIVPEQGPNYRQDVARFTLSKDGRDLGVMEPAKRLYTARQMPTTEAAIRTFGFSQLYVSLGDQRGTDSVVVRFYHKPLITLIWIGAIIMAFGGTLSLADRRLRIGVPKTARLSGAMEPAE